jgi:hypothetical protein
MVPGRLEARQPDGRGGVAQEVFGMTETPRLAGGRVPLLLELVAPNQRPLQVRACAPCMLTS